ncbi:hypothetical protein [Teichococcus wenyumeiae]|uniref:hypothetical protein n=1 Tax=Teichococcus wenyumeiae TaxID=2478470 RepID=UPI0018F4B056|nr:hypothetical protein [Pseudoroseomonas wenyumeiae]
MRANNRAALFLMDYARQRRLKIFGRMHVADAWEEPLLAERPAVRGYAGRIERAVLITVEAATGIARSTSPPASRKPS